MAQSFGTVMPAIAAARIGAIVRDQKVIMTQDNTVVEEGDHVIIFLADRRHVEQVERLFMTATPR